MNIETWPCAGKTVFVRSDLNVPIKDGRIYNDYRLIRSIPTITYLLEKQATVVLATHLGRPKGHDSNLSTECIATYLSEHKIPTTFCPTLEKALERVQEKHIEVIVLENLRFLSGEQSSDQEERKALAQKLSLLGEYYVNDAWGTEHRNDTSLTTLAEQYTVPAKSYGFLVEQELHALDKLKNNPDEPFAVIVGGGKVADKLPYIERLVTTTKANPIFVGPALSFSFLKAQGISVGNSLVDDSQQEAIKNLMEYAQQQGKKIVLQDDVLIACQTLDGPLAYTSIEHIPEDGIGVTVGPQTTANWTQELKKAKTILFNGAMGFFDRPTTMYPLGALLQGITHADAYTVVAGGDAVAAVFDFEKEDEINFCSTGGGATLAYITDSLMPGLNI